MSPAATAAPPPADAPPATATPLPPPKPYPGLASFQDTPGDRALFFGREKERLELLDLVLSEPLVVVFGRSGLGKTSLLNARLFEDLRQRRFLPVPVRLTHDPDGGPVASLLANVRTAAAAEGVAVEGDEGWTDLWHFFHRVRFRSGDRFLRPVLVIDQFEELFTTLASRPALRDAFIGEFADLVRGRVPDTVRAEAEARIDELKEGEPERERLLRVLYGDEAPEVKVVIALREDYLPDLHSLREKIPFILRTSLRLEPLTLEQARDAIGGPSTRDELLGERSIQFDEGVIGAIVEQLRVRRRGRQTVLADRIDPVQLQILCRFLDERRGTSRRVTLDHVRRWGGVREAIERYYEGVMRKFPRLRLGPNARGALPSTANLLLLNRPRAAIQNLCETGLIDPSGYRTALITQAVERKFGVPRTDLDRLATERLVNAEPRFDTVAYELAHDSLVKPLRANRRRRLVRWGAGAAALAVIAVVVPLKLARNREEADLRATVEDVHRDAETRTYALSRLSERTGGVLSGLRLDGLNFAGMLLEKSKLDSVSLLDARLDSARMDSASLRGAMLNGASLRGASLVNADLSRATMAGVNAQGADLRGAGLDGVRGSGIILAGANLTGARLDNAQIRDSDLSGATLDSATIDGANFTGTAWWLAKGWSPVQFEQLRRDYPAEALGSSALYRNAVSELDSAVFRYRTGRGGSGDRSRPSGEGTTADLFLRILVQAFSDTTAPSLATQYNRRAEFRATHAGDAELPQALADADSALVLVPHAAEVLDTRAYVLLRRVWSNDSASSDRRRGDALRNLQEAVGVGVGSDNATLGQLYYHLGLAYEALRDSIPSIHAFRRASALGYTPTYERLFTPSKWSAEGYRSSVLRDPTLLRVASLDSLYPETAAKARRLLGAAQAAGIEIWIDETYRSTTLQEQFYALGRTVRPPYAPVTNSRKYSSHWCRVAFDVVPVIRGEPTWNVPKQVWDRVGAMGVNVGLVWGGSAATFRDVAHFEDPAAVRPPCRVGPTGRVLPPAQASPDSTS